MILFLNGPFSVGKTTVARKVVDRLPNTLLFDPELVGALLSRTLTGVDEPDDYQDIGLWSRLTVDIARLLLETYRRRLVIPMAVWRPDRAEALRHELTVLDPHVMWLQLTATRQTLVQRIEARGDVPAGAARSWWYDHLDAGLRMACDPVFGLPIPTDDRSADEVADVVVALVETVAR